VSASSAGVPACARHPGRPARRTCVRCGAYLCQDCGKPTLSPPPEQGYAVCPDCEGKVAPHVWNEFADPAKDRPGEQLLDALQRPRRALLRAVFGEPPLGSLLLVLWLGVAGFCWIFAELLAAPGEPAFVGFGRGIGWSLAGMAAPAVFVLAVNGLQPDGPGAPLSLPGTLRLVATAALRPAIAAFVAGVLALVAAGFTEAPAPSVALGMLAGIGALLGLASVGRGLSLRRGAPAARGLASAMLALLLCAVVAGLVAVVAARPPWADDGLKAPKIQDFPVPNRIDA
jgi:hypothetical protein